MKTPMAPRDVCRRLNLSPSRVVQLDRERLLVAFPDTSGRRLYDPDVVEAFAVARAARPPRSPIQRRDQRPNAATVTDKASVPTETTR